MRIKILEMFAHHKCVISAVGCSCIEVENGRGAHRRRSPGVCAKPAAAIQPGCTSLGTTRRLVETNIIVKSALHLKRFMMKSSTQENWKKVYADLSRYQDLYLYQQQLVETICSQFSELDGIKVLEVGCGKGNEIVQLAQSGAWCCGWISPRRR
jgi:hypothetical protein